MRLQWTALPVLLLAVLVLCGCGTIKARSHGGGTYSGVGYDLEKVAGGDTWLDWSIQGSASNIPFLLPQGLLWIVDVPMSLVADTVLLPVDALRPASNAIGKTSCDSSVDIPN